MTNGSNLNIYLTPTSAGENTSKHHQTAVDQYVRFVMRQASSYTWTGDDLRTPQVGCLNSEVSWPIWFWLHFGYLKILLLGSISTIFHQALEQICWIWLPIKTPISPSTLYPGSSSFAVWTWLHRNPWRPRHQWTPGEFDENCRDLLGFLGETWRNDVTVGLRKMDESG